MDPERLRQIEERYHAAMDLPPRERESFIRDSCGEDEDLRREVESLLAVKQILQRFPGATTFVVSR